MTRAVIGRDRLPNDNDSLTSPEMTRGDLSAALAVWYVGFSDIPIRLRNDFEINDEVAPVSTTTWTLC